MNRSLRYTVLFMAFILLSVYSGIRAGSYAEHESADDPVFYNTTFRPAIQTVQLHMEGDPFSFPLLELRGGYNLLLSFDDLSGQYREYAYSFVHCNADWTASGLIENDYVTGFPENPIRAYFPSFNTLTPYTHYELALPNEDVSFLLSGNYIIKVFPRYNPEEVILIRRFMVLDRKVSIDPELKRPARLDDRNYKHEIDFNVLLGTYRVQDPYGGLKAVLLQNGRWDNALTEMKPLFVKDDVLMYDDDQKNVFPGDNEYRAFDVKSLRYHSERVEDIRTDSAGIHIRLLSDEKRSFKRYYSQPDINGEYLIQVQESRDPRTDADYVNVTFTLPMAHPMLGGKIYVFGALSDWQCKPAFEMQYDAEKLTYRATVPVKQGYYNYLYAYLEDGATAADLPALEGMHFETENDYHILIYDHAFGEDYDRLIGYVELNSVKKL